VADSLFDADRFTQKETTAPEIGDQDNEEQGPKRYIAFGLKNDPKHLQLVDEFGIVYLPAALHSEEPVLITANWLGLSFNRMGYIVHGQRLDKLIRPLVDDKVGWIHAFRKDRHVIDFEEQDKREEEDVFDVIVTSIVRYPIDQHEQHLQDMLNKHSR